MNALAHVIVQDIYWGENELHRSNMKKDKATLETFHRQGVPPGSQKYPKSKSRIFPFENKYLFLIVYLPKLVTFFDEFQNFYKMLQTFFMGV